jgi:hypothetical protein
MANTFKFGNGEWAVGKETALAYNDENSNFKPLPFTFDRASTATVINKDGLIETVGTDEPRIDFLNNTNGHLLLEPQRQNKLPYSLDFDNDTFFDKINSSITKESGIAPDGSNSAYELKDTNDTGNTSHYFKQTSGYKAFIDYNAIKSASVFVKAGTKKQVQVRLANAAGTFSYVMGNFDLETETILTGASANAENVAYDLQNYGNGWYRCIVIGSWTESNVSHSRIEVFTADTSLTSLPNIHSYQGSGTGTLFVWGEMIEEGSYATSYIPTSGSAVTRSAETCNNAGNSNVFNDSEGVLYVETEQFTDGDFQSTYISLNQDGSSTNHLTIQHRNSGQLRIYANGFGTAEIQFLENIDMAQNLKIAVQYKQNDYKLFVNGTQYSIYPSGGSQPALTGLNVVEFHLPTSVSQFWLGKVKDLKVYNTALSDSELQALTS